ARHGTPHVETIHRFTCTEAARRYHHLGSALPMLTPGSRKLLRDMVRSFASPGTNDSRFPSPAANARGISAQGTWTSMSLPTSSAGPEMTWYFARLNHKNTPHPRACSMDTNRAVT